MNENLPLLFLPAIAQPIKYSSLGFGPKSILPERDRQLHGDKLILAFQNVWARSKEIKEERTALSLPTKTGTYIEFQSAAGFDLVTKSLEFERAKIRLLNIRDEKVDGKNQTFATVFVPEGKENFFIKKIKSYLTAIDKRSDLPKNFNLVNSIEDVKLAILESFWTDPIELLPTEENENFLELWLKITPGNLTPVITEIEELCELYSITFFQNRLIEFPERAVCLIKANRKQLMELIEATSHIAEIRLAKETASFWVNQPNIDQVEWTEELLSRVSIDNTDTCICILDTGINNGHPLLQPVLSDLNCNAYDGSWGTADDNGHGTLMGGVAAYGDLEGALESNTPIVLSHLLTSVKILPPRGQNDPDLYGAITQQSISISEIAARKTNINSKQIFCCAITSSLAKHSGKPTSWSAAIDSITSGQADGERRLYISSGGNVRNIDQWNDYPNSNLKCSIEDPGQSWNALTVGAYTEKITIADPTFAGHTSLAPVNGLSPYSTCSSEWENKWPAKPEIILEGGNLRQAPDGSLFENFPDLSILSTSNEIASNQFDTICATSAAAAKAAWFAAQVQSTYPNAWPETIKGLVIHSASWTNEIVNQFGVDITSKKSIQDLMRICGFGVPNLAMATSCKTSLLTFVAEQTIQPYKVKEDKSVVANNMHLFELPWPKDLLLAMGATPVKLKITLCYFIEPSPGEIGWKERYRYASHGLRFDVNNVNDTPDEFTKRINIASREEGDGDDRGNSGADRWLFGANNRVLGSIHSDVWEGTAADISSCNKIAVYPVVGWWKERKHLGNAEKEARYSLIVSLISPSQEVDIYTPIETLIRTSIPVQTEIPIN